MDEAEKRRLRKLGKEIVEKRSAELRQQIAGTNPAPFTSDNYICSEIAIRKKHRVIRDTDRVVCRVDMERDKVIPTVWLR